MAKKTAATSPFRKWIKIIATCSLIIQVLLIIYFLFVIAGWMPDGNSTRVKLVIGLLCLIGLIFIYVKWLSKNAFIHKIVSTGFRWLLYFHVFCLVYLVALKWINPPITLTQLGNFVSGNGLSRDYVGYDEMSSSAKLCFIAAEDQLFPDHNGFDFKSIKKAMKHNQKSKSLRGASTISQQVAKNVFLWQGRSYIRKGLEIYFTFMIEKIWGKKRILEMYANVVEMGKGIFGVQAAAKKYFGKNASELSSREAALIAACLPNPKVYTVVPLSRYVSARSVWIQRQMNNLAGDPDVQEIIETLPPVKTK